MAQPKQAMKDLCQQKGIDDGDEVQQEEIEQKEVDQDNGKQEKSSGEKSGPDNQGSISRQKSVRRSIQFQQAGGRQAAAVEATGSGVERHIPLYG
ncbi:MAG TPA: hypothetical protein VLN58_07665 [Verrucomicrobiae bacterium]|nr:hypothetical protein [Verrucomicrobiae bacterium]